MRTVKYVWNICPAWNWIVYVFVGGPYRFTVFGNIRLAEFEETNQHYLAPLPSNVCGMKEPSSSQQQMMAKSNGCFQK